LPYIYIFVLNILRILRIALYLYLTGKLLHSFVEILRPAAYKWGKCAHRKVNTKNADIDKGKRRCAYKVWYQI